MSHDDDVPCDVRIISKMAQDKWTFASSFNKFLSLLLQGSVADDIDHAGCAIGCCVGDSIGPYVVWTFDTLTRKRTKILINIRELSTLYPIHTHTPFDPCRATKFGTERRVSTSRTCSGVGVRLKVGDKYWEDWRGGVWGGALSSPVGGLGAFPQKKK